MQSTTNTCRSERRQDNVLRRDMCRCIIRPKLNYLRSVMKPTNKRKRSGGASGDKSICALPTTKQKIAKGAL